MKILIFSHAFSPAIGGIETVSEILADHFAKEGHQVHLLTWTKEAGEKIFPYKITRNPRPIDLFKCIAWADVLLENNPCFQMSWPNLILNKPKVTSLHTWIGKNPDHLNLKETLKRKCLSLSKQLIACSTAISERISSKAIVITNPYDSGKFKIKPEIKKIKDFLFLGRLVSDKGVSMAIKAFKLFADQHAATSTSFTIVGDGPEMANLLLEVKNAGLEDRVNFLGNLQGTALVDTLNEHRYLLVPSLWDEPFGLVVLEAMACGCIPIVADGGGLPEATGKAGLIFKKGDVEGLYKCMVKITGDQVLQEQFREAAFIHLKNHQASRVANEYLAVLKAFHDGF
jgi:glycosyltransferase involved in cell wall biosynthesis